jgi:hypothetical protein
MRFFSLIAMVLLSGIVLAQESSFYRGPGLFSTRPSETKSLQTIKRFGPVGLGIDLIQPAFVMRISNVEEGSPAAATERLKKGQIIESINGQILKDIDPRIQLGQILAQAEASDGELKFVIQGEAQPVIVTVPVLVPTVRHGLLIAPRATGLSDRLLIIFRSPKPLRAWGALECCSCFRREKLRIWRLYASGQEKLRHTPILGTSVMAASLWQSVICGQAIRRFLLMSRSGSITPRSRSTMMRGLAVGPH